jgi:hypothetical protein
MMHETSKYDDGAGFTTDATVELIRNDVGDIIAITTERITDSSVLNYVTFLDEREFRHYLKMLVRFDEAL